LFPVSKAVFAIVCCFSALGWQYQEVNIAGSMAFSIVIEGEIGAGGGTMSLDDFSSRPGRYMQRVA